MSGLRRSTRSTTSTINVKLNEQNEIEYFKVENDGDDYADGEIINETNDRMELDVQDNDDDDDADGNENGEEVGCRKINSKLNFVKLISS